MPSPNTDEELDDGVTVPSMVAVAGALLPHPPSTAAKTMPTAAGEWAEPQPMATTSLRLPVEVIDQLKQQARERHLRYTSYVRSILERAARGDATPEMADITERLERIERAVTGRQSPGDQKTA